MGTSPRARRQPSACIPCVGRRSGLGPSRRCSPTSPSAPPYMVDDGASRPSVPVGISAVRGRAEATVGPVTAPKAFRGGSLSCDARSASSLAAACSSRCSPLQRRLPGRPGRSSTAGRGPTSRRRSPPRPPATRCSCGVPAPGTSSRTRTSSSKASDRSDDHERTGDPAKMPAGSVFTCRCGTVMNLVAASPPDRNAAAPSPTANGS
jgi:hypothetical protein